MQAEIETAPASERGDTVKGEIAFARRSADEGGRPGVPPRGYGELPVVNHEVTIRNVRPIADKLSLDREGFLVIRHQVPCVQTGDLEQVRTRYAEEMGPFIR